ncbi:alpha/beta hydrolase-fold protein [Corynebacterium sp.]|uniref:alpha/beta hydrolase-fold protein n=1 Tax=Corynebacterium sp. TaxID=1720 RepID=UPI0025B7CED5|nr:alpha/beta hydrolase-fold protein [Corynebacterium sp.]
MRPTSQQSRHRKSRRIPRSVLALPLALALAVPVAVPSAGADEEPAAVGDTRAQTLQDAPEALMDSPDQIQDEGRGVRAPENSPLAFMDPGDAPDRGIMRTTVPDNSGLPDGTSVEKVEWITERWVKLYIHSSNMPGRTMQVQIHLARDWYKDPERTFPSLWQLGPLYSREDESAWSYSTDAVSFYSDKNVNVVMPIGGGGTFYSDWVNDVDGKPIKWESFLMDELIPILKTQWRTNDKRGINGLSMGGTSAAVLAARHPDKFNFMASFSGYLDTTSVGMPQLFGMIDKEAGYDVTDMWGPYYSRQWREHDPKLLVRGMKGMGIYVAAGNGFTGAHDNPGVLPSVPADLRSATMESMARVTSQSFVNAAKVAGVDVTTRWRPTGTHIWPYWTHEMKESWPMAARYLGLGEEDEAVECESTGKFAEAVERYQTNQNNYDLGDCISEVYEIKDDDGEVIGAAQDYRNGVLYLKGGEVDDTTAGADEAVATWGRTSAKYRTEGGPAGWLGWPVEPDSRGKGGGAWAQFEEGFIYWSNVQQGAGPVTMKMDVYDEWAKTNHEYGPYGYPVSGERDITVDGKTGQIQDFEDGAAVRLPGDDETSGAVRLLAGGIAERFEDLPAADRARLGWPTNSTGTMYDNVGKFNDFDHGVVYSTSYGDYVLYHGPIFNHYKGQGFEGGDLGKLVSDETINADGSRVAEFEGGTVRADADGKITTDESNSAVENKYDSLTREQKEALGTAVNNNPWDSGTTPASPQGTSGRYQNYENGVIYTSHLGTYVIVHGTVWDAYSAQGNESGPLGFITGDYFGTGTATFEGGTLTEEDGKAIETGTTAAIDAKFEGLSEEVREALGEAGSSGTTPKSPQGTSGRYRNYENGVIYTSDLGTYVIMHGKIWDYYAARGHESSDLGFIKGDYTGIDDAPGSVEFEGGTLTVNAAGNVTRS